MLTGAVAVRHFGVATHTLAMALLGCWVALHYHVAYTDLARTLCRCPRGSPRTKKLPQNTPSGRSFGVVINEEVPHWGNIQIIKQRGELRQVEDCWAMLSHHASSCDVRDKTPTGSPETCRWQIPLASLFLVVRPGELLVTSSDARSP